MMAGVLALLLKWWATGIVAILGAAVLAYLVGKLLGKLRTFRKAGPAVVALACVALVFGARKSDNIAGRFSADDGLTVIEATFHVATNENDLTELRLKWLGPDSYQPVHVRQAVSDRWTSLLPMTWEPNGEWWELEGHSYALGTNSAAWYAGNDYASATNVTVYAMWHLGSDLPPVEISGTDGIAILSFGATSHQVVMSYGIDPSALGTILNHAVIEVANPDGVWREMYRATVMPQDTSSLTNEVTVSGFWVGRTTRWRARLEVTQ